MQYERVAAVRAHDAAALESMDGSPSVAAKSRKKARDDTPPHTFTVRTEMRTFFVAAPNDATRDNWVALIGDVILQSEDMDEAEAERRFNEHYGEIAAHDSAQSDSALSPRAARVVVPKPAGALKAGMLDKRGGGKRSSGWRQRYVVVYSDRMTYGSSDGKIKGTISLPRDGSVTVREARVTELGSADDAGLCVQTIERVYQFRCKDAADATEWLSILRGIVGAEGAMEAKPVATPVVASTRKLPPDYALDGWMEKRGGGTRSKAWRRRYFMLNKVRKELTYYVSIGGEKKGTISLGDDCFVSLEKFKDRVWGISLDTEARTFYFSCADYKEQSQWHYAITGVLGVVSVAGASRDVDSSDDESVKSV